MDNPVCQTVEIEISTKPLAKFQIGASGTTIHHRSLTAEIHSFNSTIHFSLQAVGITPVGQTTSMGFPIVSTAQNGYFYKNLNH